MGSWKRTITSPFRKACTILSPQGGRDERGKKARHSHHQGSSAAADGGAGDDVERASTQLYGDVMACAYEDVQVMWSMLDNKARICEATS